MTRWLSDTTDGKLKIFKLPKSVLDKLDIKIKIVYCCVNIMTIVKGKKKKNLVKQFSLTEKMVLINNY